MYELKINQEVPYRFSDGKESTTTEKLVMFFHTMEEVTTTIKLMMIGSKYEISFELRELEEGEINED